MDKRGTLYFKLMTGLFVLVLGSYLLARLFPAAPAYELQGAQFCEVGDGITVSGFVVRSEQLLLCSETVHSLPKEGTWIGGAQSVAAVQQGEVSVTEAGYFSRLTDGYEQVLTPRRILDPQLRSLQELQPEKISPQAFGRLIQGQSWYFATECPDTELSVGQELSLKLEGLQCRAEVCRKEGILVLRCDSFLHCLTAVRQVQAELCLQTHSGLRVSKEAVYYEDGETYIYVLQGARARRIAVEIVSFAGEDVLLRGDKLFEGAQVILTEIELEDGMVLQ